MRLLTRRQTTLGLGLALATAAAARAAAGFRVVSMAFYQPAPVLEARLGPDVDPFVAYYGALKAEAARVFALQKPGPGVTGAIVMAVKPAYRSKAWLVLGDNRLAPDAQAAVTSALEKVRPMRVTGGPFAFAITFEVWGGGRRLAYGASYPLPVPDAWLEVLPTGGQVAMPDFPLSKIWPD